MNALRTVALLGLLLISTGCSSFDRDHKAWQAAYVAPGSVQGAWEGRWESQNGHGGGRLRAIVTKVDEDVLHARFRSSYLWVLEGEDEVDFTVTGPTPPMRATGSAFLGLLKGGTYHYDATFTPDAIEATYKSKYDHGTFTLTRPTAPGSAARP